MISIIDVFTICMESNDAPIILESQNFLSKNPSPKMNIPQSLTAIISADIGSSLLKQLNKIKNKVPPNINALLVLNIS